jgi:hypothetical protein
VAVVLGMNKGTHIHAKGEKPLRYHVGKTSEMIVSFYQLFGRFPALKHSAELNI